MPRTKETTISSSGTLTTARCWIQADHRADQRSRGSQSSIHRRTSGPPSSAAAASAATADGGRARSTSLTRGLKIATIIDIRAPATASRTAATIIWPR